MEFFFTISWQLLDISNKYITSQRFFALFHKGFQILINVCIQNLSYHRIVTRLNTTLALTYIEESLDCRLGRSLPPVRVGLSIRGDLWQTHTHTNTHTPYNS